MKLTENAEPKRLRKNLEKRKIWEGRKGPWGSYDDSHRCYILLTEESDSCQNVDSWLKYSVIS
ncbi:hypothetical protein BT96DRAFT_924131 [Gymnopus androsaceus JB14]|uniref:Uncharacterized protein n=1 Tax=Gymnopus androsaceus JB14 TaxID=1447944 RepID=A0A6A4H661_9AGAR|nr:hypothetical protein BT96DRAFT_924131 [Gymnopus androsaceus JB14]